MRFRLCTYGSFPKQVAVAVSAENPQLVSNFEIPSRLKVICTLGVAIQRHGGSKNGKASILIQKDFDNLFVFRAAIALAP